MNKLDFKSILVGFFAATTLGLSINATTHDGLDEYDVKRLINKIVDGADVYIYTVDGESVSGYGEVDL